MHPEVLTAYTEGELLLELRNEVQAELRDELPQLSPEEAAVLGLLQARLNRTLEDRLKESVAEAKTRRTRAKAKSTKRSAVSAA